jgi:hypothetical protein
MDRRRHDSLHRRSMTEVDGRCHRGPRRFRPRLPRQSRGATTAA